VTITNLKLGIKQIYNSPFKKSFVVVVVVVVIDIVVVIAVATDFRHPERSVGSLSTCLKFRQSCLLLNDGFGCYSVWL
jgi:hypothetical protein